MELMKINYESDNPTVSARELHEGLEVKTAFKDCFPRMTEYGFENGVDFNPLKNEQVRLEGNREVKREILDYEISIDINKLIVLKDCLYYEGKHKYYIFQFEKEYTLMTDADKEITVCRAGTLADVIGYIEKIELKRG